MNNKEAAKIVVKLFAKVVSEMQEAMAQIEEQPQKDGEDDADTH